MKLLFMYGDHFKLFRSYPIDIHFFIFTIIGKKTVSLNFQIGVLSDGHVKQLEKGRKCKAVRFDSADRESL